MNARARWVALCALSACAAAPLPTSPGRAPFDTTSDQDFALPAETARPTTGVRASTSLVSDVEVSKRIAERWWAAWVRADAEALESLAAPELSFRALRAMPDTLPASHAARALAVLSTDLGQGLPPLARDGTEGLRSDARVLRGAVEVRRAGRTCVVGDVEVTLTLPTAVAQRLGTALTERHRARVVVRPRAGLVVAF